MTRLSSSLFACIASVVGLSLSAHAQETSSPLDLADLSVEELTNLAVTTASRNPEQASRVAAALFVLTQDDIRRSGATTIPDALRLVPGVQVAQIDGNKWAVSARGFNSRVANRLLVLMDGRTLHSSTYGGVYWDTTDTMIEDIERIEVVRGPSGATWGSNAFHGVINIITKHASQTGDGLVSADAGIERPGALSARIGHAGDSADWRLFAKGFERDANRADDGIEGHDFWKQARIGGRADLAISEQDQLRFSFEGYTGESGANYYDNTRTLISTEHDQTAALIEETDGGFAMGSWTKQTRRGGRLDVNASVEYADRDAGVLNERKLAGEARLQHAAGRIDRHSLTWGMDLRRSEEFARPTYVLQYSPPKVFLDTASVFAQDEISLFDERGSVTVGAKIEQGDYSGTAVLPNLRVRYSLDDSTLLWAAISRGVRSPTRTEHDARFANFAQTVPPRTALNPLPLPLSFELWGDEQVDPERVTAFELGGRREWLDRLSVDVSTFYYQYRDLRGFRVLEPICVPSNQPLASNPSCLLSSTQVAIPLQFASLFDGHAYGGELALSYRPRANWHLSATYSLLRQHVPRNNVMTTDRAIDLNEFFYGFDPEHQLGVRSALTFAQHWEWDVFVRYIDELPSADVDAYTEVNTRLAWRPLPSLEFALTGNNLLNPQHREFRSDFTDLPPVDVERSVYLQLRWSFR